MRHPSHLYQASFLATISRHRNNWYCATARPDFPSTTRNQHQHCWRPGSAQQHPPESRSCRLKSPRILMRNSNTPISRKRHTNCKLGYHQAQCASGIRASNGTGCSGVTNLSPRATTCLVSPMLSAPGTKTLSSASTGNFICTRQDQSILAVRPPALLHRLVWKSTSSRLHMPVSAFVIAAWRHRMEP